MTEKTTVYITKYALTQGIKKEEGELRVYRVKKGYPRRIPWDIRTDVELLI